MHVVQEVCYKTSANNQHNTHYITQAPVAPLKSYSFTKLYVNCPMWLRTKAPVAHCNGEFPCKPEPAVADLNSSWKDRLDSPARKFKLMFNNKISNCFLDLAVRGGSENTKLWKKNNCWNIFLFDLQHSNLKWGYLGRMSVVCIHSINIYKPLFWVKVIWDQNYPSMPRFDLSWSV